MLMNYGAVWADNKTNWTGINEICGISYADRIVGGTKADLGQFVSFNLKSISFIVLFAIYSLGSLIWELCVSNEIRQ